ncbi:MAG: sensor histidine kinase [Thermoleophilia bacterium]|nr:sensor histidine kinase [Thermoleophilia bacterium]
MTTRLAGSAATAARPRTLRLPRLGTLQTALLVIGIVGAAEGAAFLGLHAVSDHSTQPIAITVMQALVGWAFVGVGLFAWARRPDNRVGALMTAAGLAWFLHGLVASNAAAFYTAGLVLQHLMLPLAFALLAFPTGRLERRAERTLVAGAWVFAIPVTLLATLLGADIEGAGADAPENLLALTDDPAVADAATAAFAAAAVALAVWLVVVIAVRWRGSTPPQRREIAPIVVTGAAAGALFGLHVLLLVAGAADGAQTATKAACLLALAGLPFGFLLGLVRARVVAGRAVSRVVEELGTSPRVELRALLADALRDPSLEVAFRVADGYVDPEGRPVTLPGPGTGRSCTPVEREGRTVAVIVHDPALDREADVVRAAGGAAALALENARLEAELRARVGELAASRARIIAAGDEERRRLERDLHDGAQQRLVGLALRLGLARQAVPDDGPAAVALDGAMDELRGAIAELRELARGIHPAVLTQRGLGPALEGLVARAPVPVEVEAMPAARLPAAVEVAAYFVIAEALTNVARYSGADRAAVRVARDDGLAVIEVRDDGRGGADPATGTGLRGLADRVGALDGRLVVDSPPGRGTLVRAEVPCGS